MSEMTLFGIFDHHIAHNLAACICNLYFLRHFAMFEKCNSK
jgi:hypothetical protein